MNTLFLKFIIIFKHNTFKLITAVKCVYISVKQRKYKTQLYSKKNFRTFSSGNLIFKSIYWLLADKSSKKSSFRVKTSRDFSESERLLDFYLSVYVMFECKSSKFIETFDQQKRKIVIQFFFFSFLIIFVKSVSTKVFRL